MSRSAQQAVDDYLFSMFNENLEGSLNNVLKESATEAYIAQDSIPKDSRLSVGVDAFALLRYQQDDWSCRFLAYLSILNLACQLPEGRVKRYCLSHCQMLMQNGAVYD